MNKKLELSTRRIRVYGKCATNYKRLPWVTMTGVWLEQADFKPGDYVAINIEKGKLTLTREPWSGRK